jgi:hypothetical protein
MNWTILNGEEYFSLFEAQVAYSKKRGNLTCAPEKPSYHLECPSAQCLLTVKYEYHFMVREMGRNTN